MVDENVFFRKAVIQITSSLDIKEALRRCHMYISDVMPAIGMYMDLYDPKIDAWPCIAAVEYGKIIKKYDDRHMPNKVFVELTHQWKQSNKIFIDNHPWLSPDAMEIPTEKHRPNDSFMIMRLQIEGNWLGNLWVRAEGRGRYTPAHAHLLELLREPFTVAMSNFIRHHEIVQLKDKLVDDNRYFNRKLMPLADGKIIGADSGLRSVIDRVLKVASLETPVLLLGETGVGKEVIANAIHLSSNRNHGPFIKVNCGAIPDGLVDSTLFGHEKGAFTHAVSQSRGCFERAHGGTIFFDKIAELPLAVQARLLRVLQNKEIGRVGGEKTITVDTRIISATNKNLEQSVKSNQFREDLWYRLNVYPIQIPPLRNRIDEIPQLIDYFIRKKAVKFGFARLPRVASKTISRLKSYHWPGNVRELQNLVERELINLIGKHDDHQVSFDELFCSLENAATSGSWPGAPHKNGQFISLDEIIKGHIQLALQHSAGKIGGPGGAADLLQINAGTLRSRMKKMGIVYGRNKKNGPVYYRKAVVTGSVTVMG